MSEVQAPDALVGSWRLVSWENRADDGQVTYPMGSDALGCLLYTADGHFSVTISRRAGLDSPPATSQRKRRGAGPGRGRLCGLRGPLQRPWRPRHPSCGAVAVPQLDRTDQERWVEQAGDQLTLSASLLLLAGKQQVPRLLWERVNPSPEGD